MAIAAGIQVQVLLYQDYSSFFLLFSESPDIDLTHSEIISFVRVFVTAVKTEMINPFEGWDNQNKKQALFYINLIRTFGITHCDRSRIAQKCLNFIDEQKKTGYPE